MKNIYKIILMLSIFLAACSTITPRWESNYTYSGVRISVIDIKEWEVEKVGLKVSVLAEASKFFAPMKKLRHRVLWYKTDGQPIKTTLSYWQKLSLKRGARQELVYIAPSLEASSYLIEFEDL
jgi:uncharacterized protein YcfL